MSQASRLVLLPLCLLAILTISNPACFAQSNEAAKPVASVAAQTQPRQTRIFLPQSRAS